MDKTQVLVIHDQFNYNEESEDDNDDALSFCNLSLGNDDNTSDVVSSNSSSSDDVNYDDPPADDTFEFLITTTESLSYSHQTFDTETVLFCGKSIPCRSNSKPINITTLPHKTTSSHSHSTPHATSSSSISDPVFPWSTRSASSLNNKAQSSRFHNVRTTTPPPVPPRSSSFRLPETGNSRCYSSSSRSSSRKQYNFLIGLTKFPPRMELSEMRKRRSRRAPVPMFSAACGGDQPVGAGGESKGRGHWGLLRPLRFRSNLVRALARLSFGCIRHV